MRTEYVIAMAFMATVGVAIIGTFIYQMRKVFKEHDDEVQAILNKSIKAQEGE